MKNILLYFALFMLVILLLLPIGLKIFGQNLYREKKNIQKYDEWEILNCTKINETINTTFMNGKAYNIKYDITGNYVPKEEEKSEVSEESQTELPDEIEHTEEEGAQQEKALVNDFKDYAEIKFKEEENLTEFKVFLDKLDPLPEQLQNHARTIDEVSSYYRELSFSCTTQKV